MSSSCLEEKFVLSRTDEQGSQKTAAVKIKSIGAMPQKIERVNSRPKSDGIRFNLVPDYARPPFLFDFSAILPSFVKPSFIQKRVLFLIISLSFPFSGFQ